MDRIGQWWSERPRKPPAEYAVRLARKRVWRDVARCFIAGDAEVEEASGLLLDLDDEVAHALVLVLSRQPARERLPLATQFYARRRGSLTWRGSTRGAARAAAAALMVLPLTRQTGLDNDRVADLLVGLHQGDDLSVTPPTTLAELESAIAAARADLAGADELAPQTAATAAVLEALAPASATPATREVLMRATWAVLVERGPQVALELLVTVDAISPIDGD